jgi:hypothetical protein
MTPVIGVWSRRLVILVVVIVVVIVRHGCDQRLDVINWLLEAWHWC